MDPRRIVILYGSETGTAQDLAEQIWRESKRFHFCSSVQAMNSYPIQQLISEKVVVFVCATTGVGEEPENMKVFWKFLLRKSLPPDSLDGVRFGVLGLGDSSYEKFNFVAKKLHKRVVQLGGKPLLELGLCDDQHEMGLSAVALPWLETLWSKLLALYPVPVGKQILLKSPVEIRWNLKIIDDNKENYNGVCPELDSIYKGSAEVNVVDGVPLELISNVRTTSEDHFQDVRLLTFDSSGLTWRPGDVLIVRPQNRKDKVDELFALFHEHQLPFLPENMVKIEEKLSGE